MFNRLNMRKIVLLLLIIMVASFTIAGIMFVGEYGFSGFTFKNGVNTGKKTDINQEHAATINLSELKDINVHTDTEDITFIPTKGTEVKARLYGNISSTNSNYKPELKLTKTENSLNIKVEYPRNILILTLSSNLKLDIYIPESYSENLFIETSTANVNIDTMNLKNFKCKTDTGNLFVNSLNANKSELKTSTGHIKVNGVYDSFNFKSDTGDMTSSNFISKETTLETSTGKITIKGKPGNVAAISDTGDLSLEYAEYNNNIKVRTDTGKTTIKLPENAQFYIDFKSDTGDISCSFPILVINGEKDDHSIKGTVISDKNKINVNSATGDLTITN